MFRKAFSERYSLARHRGAVFAACAVLALPAASSAGSVLWDPPAIDVFPNHERVLRGKQSLKEFLADGRQLFMTRFNVLDGAGRPTGTGDSKPTIRRPPTKLFQRIAGPDANSCAGCHNQPFIGGTGDFVANVFVGAHFTDPPTESVAATITNERNTIGMFGSGAIEMLAQEMTADLHDLRAQARVKASTAKEDARADLQTKGVNFGYLVAHPDGTIDTKGVRGVDADLVVKPFGTKGVAVSLREFTIFALNQHHGIQVVERFGWPRTGTTDFDGDGVADEFSVGQVSALSAFQATLPAPSRVKPTTVADVEAVTLGEIRFGEIGCGSCHIPRLPLRSLWFFEPNPYNRPGAVVPTDVGGQIAIPLPFSDDSALFKDATGAPFVAAYTDLKRHVICDDDEPFFCNETLRQDFVPTNQFLTSKLWDAGTSAPYGHRGDLTTLSEAIIHHSGEAKEVKQAFLTLPDNEKTAVIKFLRSLQVTKDFNGSTEWR
ncbi:di-heme oxidoredictase family protein [Bradyrhizobium sp. UFLA01-814]|uniref:di-heme oxidoredictase family protein n=1 Tax=Bradyrhizobium sp. UFLA01-814 TaxID=3023480 RepID=UPI00398BB593